MTRDSYGRYFSGNTVSVDSRASENLLVVRQIDKKGFLQGKKKCKKQ